MADEVNEYEPFDESADQFTITINSFGANLSFDVTNPNTATTDQRAEPQHIGTIRMSNEDLKIMAMMMWHQVSRFERNTKSTIKVPREVLDQYQITPDEWDTFWKPK